MKLVVAYIDPARFEEIRETLLALGFPSLSALNAAGTTPDATVTTNYRGAATEQHSRPKARLECIAGSKHVSTVVDTILEAGGHRTFVYVVPVESAFPLESVKGEEVPSAAA